MDILSDVAVALFFTCIAGLATGIMVYISLDELLPRAHRYGHNHTAIIAVVLGMFLMAVSLLIL